MSVLNLRLLAILLIVSCSPVLTSAQVGGIITSPEGLAVPFCNVVLMSAADSSVVAVTTTDTTGGFQLDLPDTGSFRLHTASFGFEESWSDTFRLHPGQIISMPIILHPSLTNLKQVNIVAEKPFVERKVDRLVYNIEKSVLAAGNNGLDVLKKLPGVQVDGKEQITVRGKPGTLVLIDGKETYMSAADLANYLKGLDGGQIEKVEVITNPSAKYDASGNAVLNIVLVKDKNMGLNGRIQSTYAQGFYYGANTGGNVNYRMKKANVFVGGYIWKFKRYDESEQLNIYSNPAGNMSFRDTTRQVHGGPGHSLRTGADFFLSKKHTIGYVAEIFGVSQDFQITDRSALYNGNSTIADSILFTKGERTSATKNWNIDVNYAWDLRESERLTANFDYADFSFTNNESDVTKGYSANSLFQQTSALSYELPGKLNIKAGKIDYERPLGKHGKAEAGMKVSSVTSDNNALYWNVVNGVSYIDVGKTNHFIYHENIYAAYINYAASIGKRIDVQAGVRAEDTESSGKQLILDSVLTKSYLQFFPSAFFNYRIDSLNTISLSYGRRVDRPEYGELNPFRFFRNPFSYGTGNPYLRPMMTNTVSLDYVYNNRWTVELGYLHMIDAFTPATHQDNITHMTYTTNQNLGTYDNFNLLLATNYPLAKWWSITASVNTFYDHYFGESGEGYYSRKLVTTIVEVQNSFSFGKGWNADLQCFYRSVNVGGLVTNDPIYNLNAGIRKSFADDRGNISLNCEDILWSDRLVNREQHGPVDYVGTFYGDSRRLRLSVSWKFGRSQYERQEKSQSALEEMNRAKK